MRKYLSQINKALDKFLPPETEGILAKAMRYSVLSPAKRFRPILTLATCEAVGGDVRQALPAACAIEFIHTYTLIHDDLPAMDNDDFRRGQPTSHKVFGEAMAILAGDALNTLAFQLIAEYAHKNKAVEVIKELAKALGISGVVGGQVLDLGSQGKALRPETLNLIYKKKTGALIRAAVRIGGILGGAKEKELESLTSFGEHLGLAFQITDDLLDQGPYLKLFGSKEARKLAEKERDLAISRLKELGPKADTLKQLAKFVVGRKR